MVKGAVVQRVLPSRNTCVRKLLVLLFGSWVVGLFESHAFVIENHQLQHRFPRRFLSSSSTTRTFTTTATGKTTARNAVCSATIQRNKRKRISVIISHRPYSKKHGGPHSIDNNGMSSSVNFDGTIYSGQYLMGDVQRRLDQLEEERIRYEEAILVGGAGDDADNQRWNYQHETSNSENVIVNPASSKEVRKGARGLAAGTVTFGVLALALFGCAKNAMVIGGGTATLLLPWSSLPIQRLALATGSAVPSFISGGFSFLKFFTAAYMTSLERNPIVTKSVTAGIIGVFGDLAAQKMEGWFRSKHEKRIGAAAMGDDDDDESTRERLKSDERMSNDNNSRRWYDRRRGSSTLVDGLFISGPLLHLAYELFERVLPSTSSTWAALCHVVADSVFLDALFVATTFVVTGLVEGYTPKEMLKQLKRDYKSTLMASWATSIGLFPLGFVCFRYLPVPLRVLAVNCIDVVWGAVVSFFAHRNRRHETTSLEASEDVVRIPPVQEETGPVESSKVHHNAHEIPTLAAVAC